MDNGELKALGGGLFETRAGRVVRKGPGGIVETKMMAAPAGRKGLSDHRRPKKLTREGRRRDREIQEADHARNYEALQDKLRRLEARCERLEKRIRSLANR